MMKLFLDANVLIDIVMAQRPHAQASSELYDFLTDHPERFELLTSCDLITTLYYVFRKELAPHESLAKIKVINRIIRVIEFGSKEVNEAIELMERNPRYTDLEDTIQYVIARKSGCDYIVTNDQAFASGDVPILSSREAWIQLSKQHR